MKFPILLGLEMSKNVTCHDIRGSPGSLSLEMVIEAIVFPPPIFQVRDCHEICQEGTLR